VIGGGDVLPLQSPTNAVRFLIWGDSDQIITRKNLSPASPQRTSPLSFIVVNSLDRLAEPVSMMFLLPH